MMLLPARMQEMLSSSKNHQHWGAVLQVSCNISPMLDRELYLTRCDP